MSEGRSAVLRQEGDEGVDAWSVSGSRVRSPKDIPEVVLAGLFDYWLGIRAGAEMPSKESFDPIPVARLLPHIFMVSAEGPEGRLRFGFVGEEVEYSFGCRLNARWLTDAIPDEQTRLDIETRNLLVVMTGRPTYAPDCRLRYDGLSPRYAQLLLPLSSAAGVVRHVCGGLAVAENQSPPTNRKER